MHNHWLIRILLSRRVLFTPKKVKVGGFEGKTHTIYLFFCIFFFFFEKGSGLSLWTHFRTAYRQQQYLRPNADSLHRFLFNFSVFSRFYVFCSFFSFFLSIVRCQLPHNLLDNVRIRPRVLSSYKNDKMSTLSPVRWRWWYDNTHPLIYVHNAHGSNCVDGSIHICLCYTHVPHISHHICTFMIKVYILRWSLGTTSAISFRCLYNYRICAAVGYSTYTQYLLLY